MARCQAPDTGAALAQGRPDQIRRLDHARHGGRPAELGVSPRRRRAVRGRPEGGARARSRDHRQRGARARPARRWLIDSYTLLIHPLMLGSGRRRFDDTSPLTDAPVANALKDQRHMQKTKQEATRPARRNAYDHCQPHRTQRWPACCPSGRRVMLERRPDGSDLTGWRSRTSCTARRRSQASLQSSARPAWRRTADRQPCS
jgi:hypothetical protein